MAEAAAAEGQSGATSAAGSLFGGGVIGPLISAASDFYQGHQNREAAKNANYMSNLATIYGRNYEMDAATTAYERQKDAAQNAIAWRTADALRSGIHPLYALGAGGVSPSISGGSGSAAIPSYLAAKGDFGSMGQDLGRAAEALMSPPEKLATTVLEAKRVELIDAQIALTQARTREILKGQPGTPPDAPQIDGQGHKVEPPERKTHVIVGTSGAQTGEDEFGETGEKVIGLPKMGTWLQAGGSNQLGKWATDTAWTDYLFRQARQYFQQLGMRDVDENLRPRGPGRGSVFRRTAPGPSGWKGHW